MLNNAPSGSVVSPASSSAGRQYADGVAAAMTGDNATAHDLLWPLADGGDPFAQDDVGMMYAKGYGVAQDLVLAAKWFMRAAEQGHSCGQYHLGLCYQEGHGVPQDHVLAYAWFNLAAASETNPSLRGTFTESRRNIERMLGPAQLAEGQGIARSWRARPER